MCEYCDKDNTEESLRGSDGIVYNEKKDKFYIYIEHFLNEKNRIEVNFCPQCGIKLG
jgi:hypothetical protein